MSIDTFETATLTRIVRELEEPDSFLLNGGDSAFGGVCPGIQTEDSEEIHFDVEDSPRRISPFVSPIHEGEVVEQEGFTTKSFRPAYVKDKRIFDPDEPLKRSMGEQIGGELSPMERRRAKLAAELQDQIEMLTRREEAMIADFLDTGTITVDGPGYDAVSVDLGRASALNKTLTGTDSWDDSSAGNPYSDLESWAEDMADEGGGNPTDVILAGNVWTELRTTWSSETKDILDREAGQTNTAELGPMAGRVRFLGMMGDFRFWVYTATYIDRDGNTQKFVPDDHVYMINQPQVEGVRAYGVIRDEAADYAARRFFSKSWLEEDPAVRYLMLQSAPLPFAYRPNATLGADVINA